MLVEDFGGRLPAERLAGPAVEGGGDGGEILGAVAGEVGAPREVLPQQAVGVLVGAALPRTLRVAEYTWTPLSTLSLACSAISAPWSQVSERRSCSGSSPIAAAIASRTCSAPWPVTGGPFLVCGASRSPVGGSCSSIVKRLARSTSVPIAEDPSRGSGRPPSDPAPLGLRPRPAAG
jgi:hypothetical protein